MTSDLLPDALIDAHVHSLASDGALTLRQLANLAKRSGLSAFVPCDHDVIHDPEDLADAAGSANVQVFSGVELTTTFGERSLHLLAYGFEPKHSGLLAACKGRQEMRQRRFAAMREELIRRKVRLDPKKLDRIAAGRSPGRRHLAMELVAARLASSVRTAFAWRLAGLGGSFVDEDPLFIADAISIVHAAGGKAILAHPPANVVIDEWRALKDAGLDGIETDYPRLAKSHRRFLMDRVTEYGFLATAGSDYHGDEPRDHLGGRSMTGAAWRALTNA